MSYRPLKLGSLPSSADLLFLGVWTLVLIVALVLQAVPVFFLVMIFALAVGVPAGAAIIVIPTAVIAMICVACVIASKLTKHPTPGPEQRRAPPQRPTGPRLGLADNTVSLAERYREQRRFG